MSVFVNPAGRYAVTVAMLNEALGGQNATLDDIAYRSFAWASYCTQDDGVNLVGPHETDVWFRIHVGGGILQMALAAMLTPRGPATSDHLLLAYPLSLGASVPSAVLYKPGEVAWTSSSIPSTDRLRVSFAPQSVVAGGVPLPRRHAGGAAGLGPGDTAAGADWWSYDPADGRMVISHATAHDVVVSGHK